ncbi:hypothetical protein Tco_0314809, partial [Tanacetum coccineum]
PMLAIAAAGNDDAGDDDAAHEDNAAADEAAVPNPVSSVTDWRPWPSVPAHTPIRDPTPAPVSPPTPPAQTFSLAEPLVFGPVPRPAGYVDPDTIDPIIFDPALEEPVIFGPPPRPDNYIEPEDIDNLVSMEDD